MANKISCAPMMDWTDRHCRFFLRQVSPRTRLYTEMVVAQAVVHGDRDKLLAFSPVEHPVALQLGGSEPAVLAHAAKIAGQYGYDEINLNVGCPSDRVQNGQFGACLMSRPELVRDCVAAMRDAAGVPVSVKTRIGIDEHDSWEFLHRFVDIVAQSGVSDFVVHARKAILQGLSPKQNRQVPPLDYSRVYRLRSAFPGLAITVNGGIASVSDVFAHLRHVDGVMLGRAAYHNPYLLAEIDAALNSASVLPTRQQIVMRCLPYLEARLAEGVRLISMTRHMLGLYQGQPGARQWRRRLSEGACVRGAGVEVVTDALDALPCAA